MARLSLRKRPIHQDPSPAFRHSMRSPSTNPRSLFDSPPQEYVARHQQGNRVGRLGATCAIIDAARMIVSDNVRVIENVGETNDNLHLMEWPNGQYLERRVGGRYEKQWTLNE